MRLPMRGSLNPSISFSSGLRELMPVAALWVLTAPLAAQPVISTKAGLISFVTGEVYVDQQPIGISPGSFSEVNVDAVLQTGAGRAEVMLGSCAVLRLDTDSSFRMLDRSLSRPRVELLDGSAVVDVASIGKGSEIDFRLGAATITMSRKGLYRIDLSPAQLKVFTGQAAVDWKNANWDVTAGRVLAFDTKVVSPFDKRKRDGLDLWSLERGTLLAREQAAQGPTERNAMSRAAAAQRAQTNAADGRTPDWNNPSGPRQTSEQYAPLSPPLPAGDTGCRFP
jgi:hypothetical protein